MRHAVICGLAPALQYFSTLSYKRHDFRKEVTERIIFFSTNLSETFLIPRRVHQDVRVTTNTHTSSCNLAVVLVIFYRNLNFLRRFSKNTQISNFIQIWGPSFSMRTDRRTDMTKLIVALRHFVNAPKKKIEEHRSLY
jgi:hypothetical protein